jgi:hypothetical protein
VRLADAVTTLVIERGVQEEAVVLDAEALLGLAQATLAQGQKLLALGKRPDGDRPLFERNWHREDQTTGGQSIQRKRSEPVASNQALPERREGGDCDTDPHK